MWGDEGSWPVKSEAKRQIENTDQGGGREHRNGKRGKKGEFSDVRFVEHCTTTSAQKKGSQEG